MLLCMLKKRVHPRVYFDGQVPGGSLLWYLEPLQQTDTRSRYQMREASVAVCNGGCVGVRGCSRATGVEGDRDGVVWLALEIEQCRESLGRIGLRVGCYEPREAVNVPGADVAHTVLGPARY